MEESVVHGKGENREKGGWGSSSPLGTEGREGSSGRLSCFSDCSFLSLCVSLHSIAGNSFTPEKEEVSQTCSCEPCCGSLPAAPMPALSTRCLSRAGLPRRTALGEVTTDLPLVRQSNFIPGIPFSPTLTRCCILMASFGTSWNSVLIDLSSRIPTRSLFPKTILLGHPLVRLLSGCSPLQMLLRTCRFVYTQVPAQPCCAAAGLLNGSGVERTVRRVHTLTACQGINTLGAFLFMQGQGWGTVVRSQRPFLSSSSGASVSWSTSGSRLFCPV